jgi:hypothetical protein
MTTLLTTLMSLRATIIYLPEQQVVITSRNNNEELMVDVKTWLRSQAAYFFDTGVHKTYSPIQVPQFR